MLRILACGVLLWAACEESQPSSAVEAPNEAGESASARFPVFPPHRRLTYVVDSRPECTTENANIEAAARGFAFWGDFGVEVVKADVLPPEADGRRNAVLVCLSRKRFWGSRLGSTQWTSRWAEMAILASLDLADISSVAAHELGHVIFESATHLPDEQCGLMGGNYIWPGFSEADIAFAAERGLEWIGGEPYPDLEGFACENPFR